MNKLRLSRFKAFEGEIIIPLNDRKNLLLYGENGAGKSSIYEAVKVIFFREKLESRLLSQAQTPEDQERLKIDLWSSFNNKTVNQDFEVQIDDRSYRSFVPDDYQVFMISIDELSIGNKIDLNTLLKKFYLFIPDIDRHCEIYYEQIQAAVNSALANFMETVSVIIDKEDNYTIKIVDSKKRLERTMDLRMFFNEAKLNLIVMLVLLNAIVFSKSAAKQKILVLDDFITSLDSSNRTFLTRYIFQNFQDTQILILTHNISFYNLIMYIIREVDGAPQKWAFYNLFEIDNAHKLYVKSDVEKAEKIKNDFIHLAQPTQPSDIESIGNRVRKKFEVLLYEYSKLLMIGTVEETKKILERITNGKPVYYKNKNAASDLVDRIEQIIQESSPHNLAQRLLQEISEFKVDELGNLQKILKELKLYQKVTMHPMSHGVVGLPTFTVKEIQKSIELLEKMETHLNDLVNRNVAVV